MAEKRFDTEKLVNRLLDLPYGEGTDALEDHMKVLAAGVKADAAATLIVRPGETTAKILSGAGLATPAVEWSARQEIALLGEMAAASSGGLPSAVRVSPGADPFLDREAAAVILIRPLRIGERRLVTLAIRRNRKAFTTGQIRRFASVSGVINLMRVHRYFLKEPDGPAAMEGAAGLGLFTDFHESMVKELSRARRAGGSVSMGIITITGGSAAAGDDLSAVAGAFRGMLRNFDTLDRYGANMLAIILPDLKRSAGVLVLDRVLGEVVSSLGEKGKELGIFIGLSSYPEDGSTVERLIEMAEAAMNKAIEESTPGVYRWEE